MPITSYLAHLLMLHNMMTGSVYVTFNGLATVPTWNDYSITATPSVDLFCVAHGGPSSSHAVTAGSNGAMYKTVNGGKVVMSGDQGVVNDVMWSIHSSTMLAWLCLLFLSMDMHDFIPSLLFLPTFLPSLHTTPLTPLPAHPFFLSLSAHLQHTGLTWSALTISSIPQSTFKYHAIGKPRIPYPYSHYVCFGYHGW